MDHIPLRRMDDGYASGLWITGYILSQSHIVKHFVATRVATHNPSYSAKIGEIKPSIAISCQELLGNGSLTLSSPPQSPKGLPASATTGKKSLASCPWSGETDGSLWHFKEKRLKKPADLFFPSICPLRTGESGESVDAETSELCPVL